MVRIAGFLSAVAVAAVALTQGAFAADMPLKARPAPVAMPVGWTGYYIGGNIGYGWGDTPTDTTGVAALGGAALATGSADLRLKGWFSGLQSGYNMQIAPSWLVGFESDFQYSNIKGDKNCLVTCGSLLPSLFITSYNSFAVSDRLNWFGTVRGRLGYVAGPTLFYATGGLAYGEVERRANLIGNLNFGLGNTFVGSYDNRSTKTGWTAGGGIETKLSGAWSAWTAKLEYLYVDLGNVSDVLPLTYVTSPFPGATRTVHSEVRENIVRFGMNYQFGPRGPF
jgi:outer membrane immunogenic protein